VKWPALALLALLLLAAPAAAQLGMPLWQGPAAGAGCGPLKLNYAQGSCTVAYLLGVN